MENKLNKLNYGKRYPYKLEKFSRLEDILSNHNIKENISKIETGNAGKQLLEKYGSKFLDKVKLNVDFDPLESDNEFNPLIYGYRLSSYMFFITNNNELIKLVPLK